MRCWRGGSSTWSFVSRHQDTSTVPHQGFILEPARAFTRERQKLGAGGVAALVERTLEGGDWCLEDLSFYSFCSDPPFWAAANPSFGSHGWEEGKARRQLVEKKVLGRGKVLGKGSRWRGARRDKDKLGSNAKTAGLARGRWSHNRRHLPSGRWTNTAIYKTHNTQLQDTISCSITHTTHL